MLEDFAGLIEHGSRDEQLLSQIDFTRLPRHIAVIMDGNGRWAKRRHLPRIAGHRAGVEAVRSTVETSARLGIEALTLYAFSVENWKRPPFEIEALMTFLKEYLRKELDHIHRNNIRFQTIGRTHELDESVQFELRSAMHRTAQNTGMVLSVALNYGGRVEMTDAFRELYQECLSEGRSPASITEADIERHLYTRGLPDPDLMIRTSGEMRISNFLLWQIAYAEIYLTDILWPDFRRPDLFAAIIDYQKRDRRYGGLSASPQRAVVNAS
ncbi:MAG: isoprenyl transferase [Acidobacteriota bacterium]|nr:MAG: isoprenyl transferase [Acidobacteriota bacterium]